MRYRSDLYLGARMRPFLGENNMESNRYAALNEAERIVLIKYVNKIRIVDVEVEDCRLLLDTLNYLKEEPKNEQDNIQA